MADKTKIEWATYTWSPWIGCSKVHAGCTNCYAEADFAIRRKRVVWGPHGTRVKTSDGYWREPIGWDKHAADGRCPKCKGRIHTLGVHESGDGYNHCDLCDGTRKVPPHRPRVFPSLCDPFEEWDNKKVGHQLVLNSNGETLWRDEISGQVFVCGEAKNIDSSNCRLRYLTLDHLRADMFQLIDATPTLDWLLLTKRPKNIRRMWCGKKRRDNVWLVYSASDDQSLRHGTKSLGQCRDLVPVLGLSLEPLTGPINLREHVWLRCPECGAGTRADSTWCVGMLGCRCSVPMVPIIDWVIVGGESGPNARPCNVTWVRQIVNDCRKLGIPVFVKQMGSCCVDNSAVSRCSWPGMTEFRLQGHGGYDTVVLRDIKGGNISEWPADLQLRQLPTL